MNNPIYADPIMALARDATGSGQLKHPRARVQLDNPLCGDRVIIEVTWDDSGMLTELAHEVQGCALCRATASLIGRDTPGKQLTEIAIAQTELERLLKEGEEPTHHQWRGLSVFKPVHGHKSRYECVLLPFKALTQALEV
ncbi:MAG: iron-sulfur cluster assembly scaffold protein [Candidatus Thiodiazotropha sp. (ex. Lucinoma kazani)]|nr:iron-sulfur cluster assembly scaffold protein [Candidatus Thiodiazotropha sp. (ex Lucinoma borealis)]